MPPAQPIAGSAGQNPAGSQQNLNQIVLEYLSKKGYTRTEAALRQESANVDAQGRVKRDRAEDHGPQKFLIAYTLLVPWIEGTLEIYRAELRHLLWPIFVHSYLGLVEEHASEIAEQFFTRFSESFEKQHEDDLRILKPVRLPEHLESNDLAKLYRNNQYRLTLTIPAYNLLIQFLESKVPDGGTVILDIIQRSLHLLTVDRAAAGKDKAYAAVVARLHGDDDLLDEDEGIPGHNPGSANTAKDAPKAMNRLFLGPAPTDPDFATDVRDGLEEEDARNPPAKGQSSLVEEYDQQIKREQSEEAVPWAMRAPMPVPLARDVTMEVQRIKENRDRFKTQPRSSGVGAGISVCMFTFHNSFDSINCIDFCGDNLLVAAGTAESYIRVWSLDGKPLKSISEDEEGGISSTPSSSRQLIGHSAPVYAVSFSPSIANSDSDPDSPKTGPHYLLSSSADKSVILWSIDTWSCLVIYKGHDRPIWDLSWAKHGHYFLTGSNDRTARLWSTDQIRPLRIFAGHDQDVDCVGFHPNSAYVFTGSSDKTVRMWDVSRGAAVRMFTGHTAAVTCLACAPDGKKLASGDESGAIVIWDPSSGRRLKRMRGHSRGGIWSLGWSVESSLLVSGGADNTVRVWDVNQQTEGSAPGTKAGGEAGAANKADGTAAGSTTAAAAAAAGMSGPGGAKRGKAKEVTVTADQISAFLTKKTPVYKVKFTQMNLVMAGGAYLPEEK